MQVLVAIPGLTDRSTLVNGRTIVVTVRYPIGCEESLNALSLLAHHFVAMASSSDRNSLNNKTHYTKGRGTHTWPDGRKVAGQWKDGHLDGK